VERIRNVLNLVESCITEKVAGDFVEIGVYNGGLIMSMALKCKQMGELRTIHAYGTFSGITAPTDNDIDLSRQNAINMLEQVECYCSLEEFQKNIALAEYPNIVTHQGDITKINTSTDIPSKIAVLRLDTDFYESTKFELTHFEPRVSVYGYVIVDDYGHLRGSQKAVDEFKPPALNKIDYTGVWWRKDYAGHDYGRNILLAAVRDHPESECARALLDNFHHFVNLNIVLNGQYWRGCGSYMFDGQNYKYQRETLKKQEAIFNVGKDSKKVLEIGVYLGHSLLLLLLSNPALTIDCIDISSTFSPKVVEYLNSQFGNRIRFYLGTSSSVIPILDIDGCRYDMIHIDADHTISSVITDFNMTLNVALPNAYIVFDDYEAVKSYIDSLISNGNLLHLNTPWCLWTNIVTRLNSDVDN
jgi:hypothetical protein